MREEEIKSELELGIRAFIEARERSASESIDEFDETRILESAFNRLFLAIEHLCNALVLFETGNFSPKHFGDLKKLEKLKERYHADFQLVYEETYTFRGYADYRKFPEIKEKFDRAHLRQQLSGVNRIMSKILEIIGNKIDVKYLVSKSEGKAAKQKNKEIQSEVNKKNEQDN
jgi:hypothetical protein